LLCDDSGPNGKRHLSSSPRERGTDAHVWISTNLFSTKPFGLGKGENISQIFGARQNRPTCAFQK
jgi:hypothetical protein